MKRSPGKLLFIPVLILCLSLPAFPGMADTPMQKYSASFFDAFDTVTQLIGYTENEEAFQQVYEETRQLMRHYHRVFDGYNAYSGVNNLYYVNHNAASGPVEAEPELIELLLWAKTMQQSMRGTVNIAMGAVLSVWHEYRAAGSELPPLSLLEERARHTDIGGVVIDSEAGTVFFEDPLLTLDLGAVAKGWAVEKTASLLRERMPSFILSAGGNVRCGAPPRDGRVRWGVSIQDPGNGVDPMPNDYLDVLYLNDLSVVTSGDYQRYYTVDGVRYHHIIDPDTLMPSRYMRAVTVVTRDSGLADLLSTALYLMPYEEGRAFAEELGGVEVYWMLNDGTVVYTEGLKGMLLSEGASARD